MHFKGLDLNLLVFLDALLDERSVTKASLRLHVSQPAVSAALAKLRWHTGDQLLQKVGRTMQLTPRAKELAGPVKDILNLIRTTIGRENNFDPMATDRLFTVAMSSYCAQVISPILTQRLTESYPAIRYTVESLSADSIRRVRNGDVHLCVTSEQLNLLNPHESSDDLCSEHLFVDEWVLISDISNTLVSDDLDFENFCKIPYVETRFGQGVLTMVEDSLSRMRSHMESVVFVPDFHLAMANVVNSGCTSIVPSLLVDFNAQRVLKMQPPPFPIPQLRESVFWHSRNDAEPGLKWFRELLLEIGKEIHQPIFGRTNGQSETSKSRKARAERSGPFDGFSQV